MKSYSLFDLKCGNTAALRLPRALLILIGVSCGIIAVVMTGPEMKAADRSVTSIQQAVATALIAGSYFLIAWLAIKDIRASSLLTLAFTLLSTPLFGLLAAFLVWLNFKLFSWVFVGIAGNVALFVTAIFVFLPSD